MELKKGYKQTELGVIPEDWSIISIGDSIKIRHGKNQNNVLDPNGQFPILGTGGLMGYANDFLYSKPSVLIGRKGTIDKPMFLDKPFWTVDTLFYSEVYKEYSAKFLYYKFLQIKWYSYNEASGVPSLNAKTIESIKIAVPNNKLEQVRIENILSDADTYITGLEKLIEKKQAIKQGAMQELLKPKDGWGERLLTDIVDFTHGKAHEQFIVEDGTFCVVNSKFISTEGKVTKFSNQSFLTAKKNDILTVLSDLPNGKALAKCFFVERDNYYAVNQRICIWRSKNTDPKFLFYLLNRHPYFLALNDGVSQTHILNHHIKKCKINIPLNKSEQENIGEILSSVDKELAVLELKLEKAKAIKQGMMQNLLTGKIRLL
jgi:type I restriction enzyme S subunit